MAGRVHGVTLLELATQPVSLEDAYLQMTARAAQYRGSRTSAGTYEQAAA